MRNRSSRTKQQATFYREDSVESPVFGGSGPVEDCWKCWGLNSNAYKVEDPTGRAADGDFPGDFGSAGAPTHLEDALGGFNFVAMKYVK